jgi:hypothetical protein
VRVKMNEFEEAVMVKGYLYQVENDELIKLLLEVFQWLYSKDIHAPVKFMECDFDHYENRFDESKLHYHLIDEMVLYSKGRENLYSLALKPDRFLYKGIYWSDISETDKPRNIPIVRGDHVFEGYKRIDVSGVDEKYIKDMQEIAVRNRDKVIKFMANVIIKDHNMIEKFFIKEKRLCYSTLQTLL